jgi:hypothetical protein
MVSLLLRRGWQAQGPFRGRTRISPCYAGYIRDLDELCVMPHLSAHVIYLLDSVDGYWIWHHQESAYGLMYAFQLIRSRDTTCMSSTPYYTHKPPLQNEAHPYEKRIINTILVQNTQLHDTQDHAQCWAACARLCVCVCEDLCQQEKKAT